MLGKDGFVLERYRERECRGQLKANSVLTTHLDAAHRNNRRDNVWAPGGEWYPPRGTERLQA